MTSSLTTGRPGLAPAAAAGVAGVTRLLLVEDSATDAALLADYFDAPGLAVVWVDRIARALDQLAAERYDAVLLDLSLPDASGLEGVERVCAAAPDVPVVVMTGLDDDRLAVAAVHAGARDYLVKGDDGARVVRRAVRYAIERQKLGREREALLAREQAAREAAERATRARDEVLGIVSHDLRTPLGTILMAARSLQRDRAADVARLADVVARSGQWALHVIRDLLDVTAMEAGRLALHPEPMTVPAIVETLESMFRVPAEDAGVTLVVERGPAPRWVTVDVDRVVQAVGNLLGNALKFTPRGGRVALTVSGDDHAVRFRVEDTGPGIPAEDLPNLFDRFWQARTLRRGGAGLGLAIAKGIAEGHGGRIDVESAPGAGSAFTLVLPADAPGGR